MSALLWWMTGDWARDVAKALESESVCDRSPWCDDDCSFRIVQKRVRANLRSTAHAIVRLGVARTYAATWAAGRVPVRTIRVEVRTKAGAR